MIKRPWRNGDLRGAIVPGSRVPGVEPLQPAITVDGLPLRHGARLLRSWSFVAAFSPELMLYAASVRVAGVAQSPWAIWDRARGVLATEHSRPIGSSMSLSGEQVKLRSGSSRLELTVTATGDAVEVVSPLPGSVMWTRKIPVRVDGHMAFDMEARPVSAAGILDTSGGYRSHRTSWERSAGVGTDIDGRPIAWTLVKGVHDESATSERTVWVDGRPSEVPSVRFSSDLDEVWGSEGSVLTFSAEATRHRGVVRTQALQSFGRFSGRLPGGIELAEHPPALGVMERHHAAR